MLKRWWANTVVKCGNRVSRSLGKLDQSRVQRKYETGTASTQKHETNREYTTNDDRYATERNTSSLVMLFE
jgi:hypothetical protein